MDNKEKNLIIDLFKRLKKAENDSSERDKKAEIFIKDCIFNQPNSVYYMIQIILIQEVAIKKLHNSIKSFQKKNKKFSNIKSKKSFLSGLLDKYIPSSKKDNSDVFNSKESLTSNSNNNYIPKNRILNESTSSYNGGSSFFSQALQTAAGVAGGMIAGNMLMNLFKKNKQDNFNSFDENYIVEEIQDVNNNNFEESLISNKLLSENLDYERDLNDFPENNVSIENENFLNNENENTDIKNILEDDKYNNFDDENFSNNVLEDDEDNNY
ncbi:Putative uncharacterized protein Yba2 [Buchnera aphidicola (Periphyllus testudinaceus)]|uniref:DUF2076 domain-containing protein n=1 Tax=Buchnera aphidicola TaxID=9 RepID=UPI00346429C9